MALAWGSVPNLANQLSTVDLQLWLPYFNTTSTGWPAVANKLSSQADDASALIGEELQPQPSVGEGRRLSSPSGNFRFIQQFDPLARPRFRFESRNRSHKWKISRLAFQVHCRFGSANPCLYVATGTTSELVNIQENWSGGVCIGMSASSIYHPAAKNLQPHDQPTSCQCYPKPFVQAS